MILKSLMPSRRLGIGNHRCPRLLRCVRTTRCPKVPKTWGTSFANERVRYLAKIYRPSEDGIKIKNVTERPDNSLVVRLNTETEFLTLKEAEPLQKVQDLKNKR